MAVSVVAIDIGASSGRAIVGHYNNGQLTLDEVHRFENEIKPVDGALRWDVPYLLSQIHVGLQKAAGKYNVVSVGIDTWGVDFGLIDKKGDLMELPVSYRDSRTNGSVESMASIMDLDDLYQMTGNQIMEINTLFQLMSLKEQSPDIYEEIDKVLLMPDLFNYLLTGEMRTERSIASTTQLTHPVSKDWNKELMSLLDINPTLFPEIVNEGHRLGFIKESFDLPDVEVINVCSHDTASAVVSVPSHQDFLFVSCGTWSLIGTELETPVLNEHAKKYNLTNESGHAHTTRFLKNATGLWIIQELKRQYESEGLVYSYEMITTMAQRETPFQCLIDTDMEIFATPGDMRQKITAYAKSTNQIIPETPGQLFRCVYESLAFKYKYTFLEIIESVGKEFDTVNILGGGSKSSLLCQMVSDASGMRVSAGPHEATAIGNIVQQLMAQGVIATVADAREWLKETMDIHIYYPQKPDEWDQQFSRYLSLLKINANKKGE